MIRAHDLTTAAGAAPATALRLPAIPRRIGAHIARSMWMADRGLAELRWAAVTLVAMGILSLVAMILDPTDAAFHMTLLVAGPAALLAIAAGWSSAGPRLLTHRLARLALGPAVLLAAAVGSGPNDLTTLAMPPAGPLVVLALSYAAITPGYPIAAAILIGATVGTLGAHAALVPAGGAADLVIDEYVVRVAVVLLAATGLFVVVRVATAAEDRAAKLAAHSRRRVDDLERLERIVRRFDGSRPVREVIQDVVDDVSREFEIALVSIYLPQNDRTLDMVGVAGYHTPFHQIDVGLGIIGRAAACRETQFVPDVVADPDYRAARDDVGSEVAAPIVHDGELLGVINFEGTRDRPLGTTHVALAEMLGRSIAGSLRSARLDEERRARLHAIERVLAVSRGLLADLDRRRMVDSVVDAAVDLLEADRVLIAMRTPDGSFRVEGDSANRGDGSSQPRDLGPDDAAALLAVASGEPIMRDAGASEMALPIPVGDEVAAVLVATRPDGHSSFGELEQNVGALLAAQVGIALHNADRHATATDAAVRDPLTGLLNRRYFDEAVETAVASARRTNAPLSLIVLDLDRFSAINNEHGHAAGDRDLRRVATALSGSLRSSDVVVRYGGEEFVVIAAGATSEVAVAVAERIRSAVLAATARSSDPGEPLLAVTVSAGVASLLDEVDGRALFRAADSALLTAKRAGRDRVVAV
ncbi:MAG: diguanylate cyclase [Chloroflexota bacterium]